MTAAFIEDCKQQISYKGREAHGLACFSCNRTVSGFFLGPDWMVSERTCKIPASKHLTLIPLEKSKGKRLGKSLKGTNRLSQCLSSDQTLPSLPVHRHCCQEKSKQEKRTGFYLTVLIPSSKIKAKIKRMLSIKA